MRSLAALIITAALVAGCNAAPLENKLACRVTSARADDEAYTRAIGSAGAAAEAVARAGRCLERGADDLAHLAEPADNIARSILWQCRSEIAIAKPFSRVESLTNAAKVDKMVPGAGQMQLQSEELEARSFDTDIREHALAAVIEARYLGCRSSHE